MKFDFWQQQNWVKSIVKPLSQSMSVVETLRALEFGRVYALNFIFFLNQELLEFENIKQAS